MSSKEIPIDEQELNIRIKLNFQRLATGDYYSIEDVFFSGGLRLVCRQRGSGPFGIYVPL